MDPKPLTAEHLTAGRTADVRIAGLSKVYDGGVTAMADVDLTIASGEFVAVVGASGCGKSTLLRILAGFERPSAGVVEVGGTPVTGPGPDRGVVFQDYGLFPWLSVRENVAYGPSRKKLPKAQVAEVTDRFIAAVGLTRFAGKYPSQLSGGMQQRVAIARVLANDPSLLLMDEPFGALDALTRSDLQTELKRIHRETRTTVVFVTHSIEEAVYLADRVVVMTGGASHGVPGHVQAVVPVDLPDRDVTSPAFNEVKRGIAELVHTVAAASDLQALAGATPGSSQAVSTRHVTPRAPPPSTAAGETATLSGPRAAALGPPR